MEKTGCKIICGAQMTLAVGDDDDDDDDDDLTHLSSSKSREKFTKKN